MDAVLYNDDEPFSLVSVLCMLWTRAQLLVSSVWFLLYAFLCVHNPKQLYFCSRFGLDDFIFGVRTRSRYWMMSMYLTTHNEILTGLVLS